MAYGRQPLRQNTRRQVSTGRSVPAPVGGWNAQAPIANMPPEDAVILENWIPRAGYVEVRKGYEMWVDDVTDVESLLIYRGGATDTIFAASGSEIYNVTSQGASAVSVYTSANSARWQTVNFSNDAGRFLIACNGVNVPTRYDGTSFADLTITGSSGPIILDPEDLIDVMAHKARLFWAEKDTLHVWFLAPNAIQGAAQLLDLGPIFYKGGTIICMDTWTLDGGAGADDLAVFVTSQGQVAIYQGLDPSDANEWALVGVYDLGIPLSRRSLVKYGSDLVLLNSDGVVPLSQALRLDRAQENLVALTQKIQDAFQSASMLYSANFGWEGVLYPKGALAIFNVPTADLTLAEQYVQNVQTGAWCKFSNMNAICWAVANDRPYFGGPGGVFVWDSGALDNAGELVADLQTAFNYFGSRGSLKKFEMLQPVFRVASTIQPAVEILTDFRSGAPQSEPSLIDVTGSLWGISLWGTAEWGSTIAIRDSWTSVTGIGYCGAVRVRVSVTPEQNPSPELLAEALAFNVKYQNQTGGQL